MKFTEMVLYTHMSQNYLLSKDRVTNIIDLARHVFIIIVLGLQLNNHWIALSNSQHFEYIL